MFTEELSLKLEKLCQEKSDAWDNRVYFKKHHSNGMCVKVLFELLSEVSPTHKRVYRKIKNIIWSHYIVMVNGTGLIEEFKEYGMKKINNPVPGAFLFLRQRNIVGHVGLCINHREFYHMCKKGFVKEEINLNNVACIGVF